MYNIGNDGSTTVLDLVRCLNRLLGTDLEPLHAPAGAGELRHSQANIHRARQELGYDPTISFVEGLERTLE